jgi:hypothetical protein
MAGRLTSTPRSRLTSPLRRRCRGLTRVLVGLWDATPRIPSTSLRPGSSLHRNNGSVNNGSVQDDSPIRTVKHRTPTLFAAFDGAHPCGKRKLLLASLPTIYIFSAGSEELTLRHKSRKWLAIAAGGYPAGDVVRLPRAMAQRRIDGSIFDRIEILFWAAAMLVDKFR